MKKVDKQALIKTFKENRKQWEAFKDWFESVDPINLGDEDYAAMCEMYGIDEAKFGSVFDEVSEYVKEQIRSADANLTILRETETED